MKRNIITIVLILIAVSLFAAYINTTTVSTGLATVIDTTSGDLLSVEIYVDTDENTAVARSFDFYDASSVTNVVADANTSYLRSVTIPAGVFTSGKVFDGDIFNSYFKSVVVDGLSYDTGLVVSPSAGTPATINGNYKYR